MVALQAVAVLGSLFLFFASAMIRAQLVLRQRSRTTREPRLASSKLASGHAAPTR